MPPRNPELPEGTDHIISGAMQTGAGADASTGSTGATAAGRAGGTGATSTGAGGGGSSGFVASGGASGGLASGTGGAAASGSSTSSGGQAGGSGSGGSSGGPAEKLAGQVKEQVFTLRDKAADKARDYADTGKGRVTESLNGITEVLNEAALSVDEKLGEQYGRYAHQAADAVSSFTQSLEGKSIEELLDDTRSAIRKSPAIAVGTAAVLGFAMMRVVKAGLPTTGESGSTQSSTGGGTGSGTSGSGGTTGTTGTSTNVGGSTVGGTSGTGGSVGGAPIGGSAVGGTTGTGLPGSGPATSGTTPRTGI